MLVAAQSCDRESAPSAKSAPRGPVQKKVPPRKAEAARPKRKPRRPLPPLGPPKQGGRSLSDVDEEPCSDLVNKVCAILSEAAEECSEARSRLERRPGTVDSNRCQTALRWFQTNVEEARRPRPCRLLAEAKCRRFGEDSTACVNARSDVRYMSKKLKTPCRAELLLFRGLP